jgi:hypothetical protein
LLLGKKEISSNKVLFLDLNKDIELVSTVSALLVVSDRRKLVTLS